MSGRQLHTFATRITWLRAQQALVMSRDLVRDNVGGLRSQTNILIAFYDRDPVDLALDWADGDKPVPVILPANEKRAGGDWEAGDYNSLVNERALTDVPKGVMSPEECLCRRSNLYATLTTPGEGSSTSSNYPIPAKSGIYSETVGKKHAFSGMRISLTRGIVVFRDGPPSYTPWQTYKSLPVISVCPVKRPKLDSSSKKYSFSQERELMRSKIVTALRIAIYYGYENLCIGTFGLGTGFRNPPEEVACLWRDVLLRDDEFVGRFRDIVFAFEAAEGPDAPVASSASKSFKPSGSKSASSSPKGDSVMADLDIFRYIFKPSVILEAFQ